MKGMKTVKLLVQQPNRSRYGRKQGVGASPASLLPCLLFLLEYPGPLQTISPILDLLALGRRDD
jgi:hypothetical protein